MTRKPATSKAKPPAGKKAPASRRPPRRRPGKGPSAAPRKVRKGHGWPLRLLFVGLLFGAILAAYMHHLNAVVRVKFEGKRWAVPAHVYARPLEIFPGAQIGLQQLQAEIEELGYRPVQQVTNPGTYARLDEQRLALHTRGFAFWDGSDPPLQVEIRYSGDQVAAIQDHQGRGIALLRLDPVQIGSIYPAHREDRVLVRYEEIPQTLIGGLLAAEDREYFDHFGVSIKGIARAMLANIKAGRTVQGGSTLTQQLVKNFYLTSERSLKRKANEALMAILLDYFYSKEDILQAYANEIYLGQDGQRAIHGFGLAARFYFNRPLRELSIKDQALLIALIRGPSYYNPVRNPKRARQRRDLILDLMASHGFIQQAEADRAKGQSLGLEIARNTSGGNKYPAFMDLVRRQLSRDYHEEDLNSEGLKIFTTLDPWVQMQSQQALAEQLAQFEGQRRRPEGSYEGALVVVGRDSGEVQAVIGGRQAEFAGFNRALDSVRSIGSLIKPPIYLSALDMPELYSLVTPLSDEPFTLKQRGAPDWSPQNYDGKSHGNPMLYQALAKSYNLATVRLGMQLGLGHVAETLRALGVNRSFKPLPSLLLGAISLTPIEVAQVYQTMASGGYRTPMRTIREVLDQDGRPLSRYPLEVQQTLRPATAYLIGRAMQRVVSEGTAGSLRKWLSVELGIAGKTGTTDELRDSWFAGFSGDKVMVVWVGRDDNKPSGLTGASGALQVWGNAMSRLNPQPLDLIAPEDVVFAQVPCVDQAMPFVRDWIPEQGACGTDTPWLDGEAVPDQPLPGQGRGQNTDSNWQNLWEIP
ncbi:penicillin-binding protein 1B [Magnetovirga frankeli]|uniref:penicillin-binding protein 1B n=1 Tax=Magnetovirga frankeli TaxID=947516 RepID=UPI001293E38D|nr:penicillin-binding protein 1B [gamma proteobacterium SS-5]